MDITVFSVKLFKFEIIVDFPLDFAVDRFLTLYLGEFGSMIEVQYFWRQFDESDTQEGLIYF